MTNIGVFCSSLDGEKIFSEKARELGALLAKENYSLVYGGGKLGLMGDLAKSVKKNDSEVISVIPSYLNKPNITFSESTDAAFAANVPSVIHQKPIHQFVLEHHS